MAQARRSASERARRLVTLASTTDRAMPQSLPHGGDLDSHAGFCYSSRRSILKGARRAAVFNSNRARFPLAVTYKISPDERIIYLTTAGDSTFDEWRDAMLGVLSDPAYRRGMGFLSDRRGQTGTPEPEFAREAAQFLMQHSDEMEGCRWAAISEDAAIYGMQRMFAILSETTGVTARAFMDYEEARRWLLEPRT